MSTRKQPKAPTFLDRKRTWTKNNPDAWAQKLRDRGDPVQLRKDRLEAEDRALGLKK